MTGRATLPPARCGRPRAHVTALVLSLAALGGLPSNAAVPPKGSAPAARPRAVVVGWDGADWKLLDPLLAQGKLPNLAALLAKGRSWNLDSYQPMASPLLWTTMATGRSPVDHGVDDFLEIDPKTGAKLPISSRSRRVPAIWNLASRRGLSVGVVGWWATWPAEKVNGFLVSDRASPVLFDAETLSRSPALTWPEGLAEGVRIVGRREGTPGYPEVSRALHVTRAEFDAAVAARKDLGDPVTGYQKILGSTRVYARTALELYDRQRPELLMLYLEGTDEIGHLLARFHPPKLASVSDEEFRKYSGGVTEYFAEADRLLGELMSRAARDGATLLLVSDHGFRWIDRPAIASSIDFETAYLWHESPGILAAAGPGIVSEKRRGKASVFDVTPTLCRLLGLPADPAFEGRPVSGLRAPAPPPPVSWERAAPAERLVVAPASDAERKAGEEFTKKLISLGYLTGADAAAVDARPVDRAGTETSGAFQNVGTYLRLRGKVSESLDWYRRALEVNPGSAPAWHNRSLALLALGRRDEADDALLSAIRSAYPDPEGALARRIGEYRRRRDGAQLAAFARKTLDAFPENDRFRALIGRALFESRDCAGAERVFATLVARRPNDTNALNLNALSSLCLGKASEARALFRRSLAIDPKQDQIRAGLARVEAAAPPPR